MTIKHPLEPLTAQEVQLAVSLLKDAGKVTPTTRFVSVSLKEPDKDIVHAELLTPASIPQGPMRELRRSASPCCSTTAPTPATRRRCR